MAGQAARRATRRSALTRPAGPAARALVLAGIVGALAAAGSLLPLRDLPQAVAGLGPAGPLAAVTGAALLLAALVPRTAVSLALGALFGAWSGAALAIGAAALGGAATFTAGRALGREYLASRGWVRWERLDAWLRRRGLLAVIVVRLMPLAPFGLVGYAYGATSVRARHYLLGTLIAAIPSAVAYAVIGAAVVAPSRVDAVAFVPAALGLLVSAAAAAYWRWSARDAAAPLGLRSPR